MRVCVDRRLLGTEQNLVMDGEALGWSHEVPDGFWHLDGSLKDTGLCLDSAFALEGVQFPVSVPTKYVEVARSILGDRYGKMDIPWQKMMSHDDHKTFLKNAVCQVLRSTKQLSTEYFEKVWGPTRRVFGALQPSHVDIDLLNGLVEAESSDSQVSALQSFRPRTNQTRVGPPKYDRLHTRTGRMTVTEGPQILTLKKESRRLVDSVYKDGSIVSMDFVALEARVAYLDTHQELLDTDIYQCVNDQNFKGRLPRSVVKIVVLCELFGMGAAGIAHKLNTSIDKAQKFADMIRSTFNLDEINSRLRSAFVDEGFIRSKFGRRVVVPEMRLLLNSYVQSTGVDVSLLGFMDLFDRVQKISTEIRPIYILHDDAMFDCPNGLLDDLMKVVRVSVPGYESDFPVKFKVVSGQAED